jgi:UDP-2,4-diacetamido-2,4,6-trideoxy-beta-L-altropyranose hydrolase
MPNHVAIRTDSSAAIGTGHLYRCLTLADALRRNGASVCFISAELPGNLGVLPERQGFEVRRLTRPEGQGEDHAQPRRRVHWTGIEWAEDAAQTKAALADAPLPEWLVVDHYAIDRRWESRLCPFAEKIMVIDDLADRPHDCDLLLDQNDLDPQGRRYAGLVPGGCRILLGPRFALLRREFIEARGLLRARDGRIGRILVFFGGSDPTNETEKGLEAIRMLGRRDIAVDVVVGEGNSHGDRVRRLCSEAGIAVFHRQAANMAELMSKADLAIGAPGTSTWERCFLGLPVVTLVIAENQLSVAVPVSGAGAIVNLGWHSEVGAGDIAAAVGRLLDDPASVKDMAHKGMELMGGGSFEGADGVAREMIGDRRAAP